MKTGDEVMDVITHYDLMIEEDNDPFRDPPALQAYMDRWDGQAFLDALRLNGSLNVLEIGVGTGRIAARVAPDCRRLTGVDCSPRTIERARENLKAFDNIALVCGDFCQYAFSETYDVIYSTLTMMHFENKTEVVFKVASLLNEGGVFCLSIDKSQSEYIDMGTRKIRIYPDTPERICDLLRAASMTVEDAFATANAHVIVSRRENRISSEKRGMA